MVTFVPTILLLGLRFCINHYHSGSNKTTHACVLCIMSCISCQRQLFSPQGIVVSNENYSQWREAVKQGGGFCLASMVLLPSFVISTVAYLYPRALPPLYEYLPLKILRFAASFGFACLVVELVFVDFQKVVTLQSLKKKCSGWPFRSGVPLSAPEYCFSFSCFKRVEIAVELFVAKEIFQESALAHKKSARTF